MLLKSGISETALWRFVHNLALISADLACNTVNRGVGRTYILSAAKQGAPISALYGRLRWTR